MTFTARICAALFLLAGVIGSAFPGEASAFCGGRDVLAELAQTDPAVHQDIQAAAARTINADAVLWKIEKPGIAPSYLFGTMHLTDPRISTLSPAVEAALAQIDRIVLEIADLSPGAMAGALGGVANLVLDGKGRLDKALAPEEFAKVTDTIAKAGLPAQLAPMVRPWLVHMLLSVPDCERGRTASGLPVLDVRVAEAGKRRNIPVIGLETIEHQLAALAAVPEGQQLDMLRVSLKFADRADDLMETMVLMYTRRQLGAAWPLNKALGKKAGVGDAAFQGFEDEVVVKRNIKMRDGALPMLAQGSTFIGVGALHLVGESGLVALFRRAGYTLTALE